MSDKRAVTIYDIAREAGVSVSTVSRVLTKSAKVSADKKERIERLMKQYDFSPNAMAQNLSSTRTGMIGIIASDIRNPFYATLILECEKAANNYGYMVILCNSLNNIEIEDRQLENLQAQRVDAIIQIGGRVDELISDENYVDKVNCIANRVPMIITGKLDGADCYQVNINEIKAMEMVAEYLIDLGHTRIAYVGGRHNVKSTVDKRLRYRQMLRRHGLPIRDEYIVETENYDDESGYQAMKQILQLKQQDRPTAVIAVNDMLAVGVVRAIKEAGLSIPDDMSIMSFDNTYLSDILWPKLSGVSYNYQAFGEKIIDVAVDVIEGKDVARQSFVEPELIIKESCSETYAERNKTVI